MTNLHPIPTVLLWECLALYRVGAVLALQHETYLQICSEWKGLLAQGIHSAHGPNGIPGEADMIAARFVAVVQAEGASLRPNLIDFSTHVAGPYPSVLTPIPNSFRLVHSSSPCLRPLSSYSARLNNIPPLQGAENRSPRPQNNILIKSHQFNESNSEDAYVCFRRRDVKSVRKTHRMDTTPAEKVSWLQQELIKAKDLANLTILREVKKLELNKDAHSVLEARIRFIELKRKHPQFSLRTDDQLLVDPECVLAKRLKMMLEQNKDPTDLNLPYLALEEQVHPHERAESFAKEIERQCEELGLGGLFRSPDEFTHLSSLFSRSFLRCITIKALGRAHRTFTILDLNTYRARQAVIHRSLPVPRKKKRRSSEYPTPSSAIIFINSLI
ncbi:uncharacterized protein EI90DRAFT_3128326 [Cantharellus anzutake]|uniref:uncharacterized protein n=1 Tax=Cantharellus anzutake TaxID=1750568 RepID=UPI0019043AA8|nr:uncharacterized protein EI90DRAFT_3128326 [Cantharellus anzutake]KAF8325789.1 hypothetical protein EI90DRAFT_3128326 [Cantharellus anzutake]